MNTKTQEQKAKDLAEYLDEEYVVSGEQEDDYRRATGKCSKHNAVLDTHFNCLKCSYDQVHSEECIDYNFKHESDTRGECICEDK